MERLTIEQIKQFPLTTYGRMIGKQLATQVMNELVAYKQIEQELGIDLTTLFKAFNEIVFRDGNVINFSHRIILIKNHYGWCIEPLEMRLQNKQLFLLLKDYGKTWALTRKELER